MGDYSEKRYTPLPKMESRPVTARYRRLKAHGYLCPRCRDPIMYDRRDQVYFCVRKGCDFRQTRDEYKLTVRDIKLTLDRGRVIAETERESDRLAHLATNEDMIFNVVYYVRFRDAIKIGTSGNPKSRLNNLPWEELVALEVGSYGLEHRRHAQFRDKMIIDEWFEIHDELEQHIARVQERRGEWFADFWAMEPWPWSRKYFLKNFP